MAAEHRLGAVAGDVVLDRGDLGVGVGDEVVDRDDRRHPELLDVLDVATEIGAAFLDRTDVLRTEILALDPAIHLERAYGRDDHRGVRGETGLAAFDVQELLGAQIGTKTGLGDHVVRELERGLGRDHRVAAMGDVAERPAMDECRVVLERLHQVGQHRLFQKHRHGTVGLEVAGVDRRTVATIGDDDPAEPSLQILQILGQAQDRHDLGRDRDVEPGLPGKAVGDPAERGHDVAQRPVVHVDHPAPDHPANVDVELVAPVDVVVQHRREQVVRRRDRVEVTGEMEVDLLHRHHLGMATAGSTTFHPEARPERRLANADRGPLAERVQAVAEADGRGRLALAGRGGLIAVTSTSLPFSRSASEVMNSADTLALSWP